MKITQYNSYTYGNSQYDISPAELYSKFDIKAIYLAYHDDDSFAFGQIGSVGNIGMSGYVMDSVSFYYFILEQKNKNEFRLTFNLLSDLWELNDVQSLSISEKIKELDKQTAIKLIEFIDLFGM